MTISPLATRIAEWLYKNPQNGMAQPAELASWTKSASPQRLNAFCKLHKANGSDFGDALKELYKQGLLEVKVHSLLSKHDVQKHICYVQDLLNSPSCSYALSHIFYNKDLVWQITPKAVTTIIGKDAAGVAYGLHFQQIKMLKHLAAKKRCTHRALKQHITSSYEIEVLQAKRLCKQALLVNTGYDKSGRCMITAWGEQVASQL